MTDLVKWLRGWPAEVEEFGQCADEIERLRGLLYEVWDAAPYLGADINKRVRKALGDVSDA
jgi:hypothetical protein